MTVQDSFTSWQTHPIDRGTCSPICKAWWQHLRTRWGGQHLGCYVQRPVVGGSAPSSHASGAALDWRYQNPGPGPLQDARRGDAVADQQLQAARHPGDPRLRRETHLASAVMFGASGNSVTRMWVEAVVEDRR